MYTKPEIQSMEHLNHFKPGIGLHREISVSAEDSTTHAYRGIKVKLIPYYARLNRISNYFKVWLPVYARNPAN
jgi:hypothetical protein